MSGGMLEESVLRLAATLAAAGTSTFVGDAEVAVRDPVPEGVRHPARVVYAVGTPRRAVSSCTRIGTARPAPADRSPRASRTPLVQRLAAAGRLTARVWTRWPVPTRPPAAEDDRSALGEGRLEVLWTRAIRRHFAFAWRGAVFNGDCMRARASSLRPPPDGEIARFPRT